jgi:cytochrome c biogenesis protein CcdA
MSVSPVVLNGFPLSNSYKLDSQIVKRTRPKHKLHAWWFPVLSTAFALFAFVSGYVIGVLRDDEEAWFSYIRLVYVIFKCKEF